MIQLVNPAGDAENLYYKTLHLYLVHQYLLRHQQSMFVPGGAAMGLRTEAPNDSFLKNISSEEG